MITDFQQIENSALNLDKKDKVRLADKLLQSIHGRIDPDIEQAWMKEVQERKASLRSGEASLHSSSEVLKEARERINR
ncbi:MAG TPA: hypothetical protein DCE78_08770 [Bacteroidetes bacterium]|nr:hypothetical protein [Bacteroidota bacterium]